MLDLLPAHAMKSDGARLLFWSTLFFCAALAAYLSFSHPAWKQYQSSYVRDQKARLQEKLRTGAVSADEFSTRMGELNRFTPHLVEISLPRWNRRDRCPTCHAGLEEISSSHPVKAFGCTICHEGNGLSLDKDEAHRGMLGGSNPSRLEVAEKSCGRITPDGVRCHAGFDQMDRNQAERVPRTIMATMTGVVTSLRVTWGAQHDYTARYGAVGTLSTDGKKQLLPVPFFDASQIPKPPDGTPDDHDVMGNPIEISGKYADDQWRKFCSRCHLWYQRDEGRSAHGAGCAGCHMLSDGDGRYLGEDIALPRGGVGYSAVHRITTAIPVNQCLRCHNRSGRIAMSYQGLMESEGYGTPFRNGAPRGGELAGGRSTYGLAPDVHWEKGMHCIDCHTGNDTMGDGTIYERMRDQVEIRCPDCHGDYHALPRLTTVTENDYAAWASQYLSIPPNKPGTAVALSSKGRPLVNVKKEGDELAVYSKVTGLRHVSPIITGKEGAHAVDGHGRLECYACHTRWAPQCYGCHDYRQAGGRHYDGMTGFGAPGRWLETRDYFRFTNPPLGIDSRGKIAPYMPGCQVLFTDLDKSGNVVAPYKDYVYPGDLVLNGIVSTPIFPHTVGREVPLCEDCHLNPKMLGLGEGVGLTTTGQGNDTGALSSPPPPGKPSPGSASSPSGNEVFEPLYDAKAAGYPIDFSWESLVTPDGTVLQGNSHKGARPFNREELFRIRRVGECIVCHDGENDPIYRDFKKSLAAAELPEHRKLEDEATSGLRSMKYPRRPLWAVGAPDGR